MGQGVVGPGQEKQGLPSKEQQLSETPLLGHVHLPTSLPASLAPLAPHLA